MPSIRIVIAEDMEIVRKGLKALLEAYPDLVVCGEAGDGREAVKHAGDLQPDVVLMDLSMPGLDGPPAIAEIKKRNPGVRILALTMHKEDRMLFAALKAGADGYVLKDVSEDELVRAITLVHRGQRYISPEVSTLMIDGYMASKTDPPALIDILSPRERQVLTLLAEGCSYKEMADRLFISPKTVDVHLTKIKRKLQAKSSAALIVIAAQAGLVQGDRSR